MDFIDVDGCPVPAEIGDAVTEVKRRSGAVLQSCYRGSAPKAQPILRRSGKKNQQQLWNESQQPGSQIRANRPGQSTHECYNDGIAYPGRVGGKLKPQQVGQDWQISKVRAVIAAYNDIGMEATVTYPNSTFERQHVNIQKYKPFKIFKSLKRGVRSSRVLGIRRNLAFVLDPQSRAPYLPSARRAKGSSMFFDRGLELALRRFQEDHGLKSDGVYGYRTAQQLAASVRFRKNHQKKR